MILTGRQSLRTSQLTMLIFGFLIFAFGLLGLLAPALLPQLLFFPPKPGGYTNLFIQASAQASLAMGSYYLLAGWFNMRLFMWLSVPVRLVNTIVFSAMVLKDLAPLGWLVVALLELVGATLTYLTLRKEE